MPDLRPDRVLLLFAVAVLAAGCATTVDAPVAAEPADSALASVAWLEGVWVTTDERGVRTEEYWTPARAGTMFGINRVIAGGRTVFFENLRIEVAEDGTLVYLASPTGRQPPTPFRLTSAAPGQVVFENPEHDYPQRITYLHSGSGLTMRIEGREDGRDKSGQWVMERADMK